MGFFDGLQKLVSDVKKVTTEIYDKAKSTVQKVIGIENKLNEPPPRPVVIPEERPEIKEPKLSVRQRRRLEKPKPIGKQKEKFGKKQRESKGKQIVLQPSEIIVTPKEKAKTVESPKIITFVAPEKIDYNKDWVVLITPDIKISPSTSTNLPPFLPSFPPPSKQLTEKDLNDLKNIYIKSIKNHLKAQGVNADSAFMRCVYAMFDFKIDASGKQLNVKNLFFYGKDDYYYHGKNTAKYQEPIGRKVINFLDTGRSGQTRESVDKKGRKQGRMINIPKHNGYHFHSVGIRKIEAHLNKIGFSDINVDRSMT